MTTTQVRSASLERTTFETSRLLEFFTEKELTMQIGHDRRLWPLALVKELIDNALDACEMADIAPEITISVEPDAVSVADNGPGLPVATLERSLDYLLRVSTNSYYVSPTRGQLGNALKCLWAAPFVVHGEHGRVDVTTSGQVHRIDVTLDRIAQVPELRHTLSPDGLVKNGTHVTLHWPGIASYLGGTINADFYKTINAAGLLAGYALLNPHATFRLRLPDRELAWTATDPGWRKWKPNAPTSPHWYGAERLRDLLAAYIADKRQEGTSRPVREVVAEFAGLSSSAKQKAVAAAAGLERARLGDLVVDGDLDMAAVGRLLGAMRAESRPIKPAALGVIGEAHITGRLIRDWGIAPESVRYKKTLDVDDDGTPFVLEVAFGVLAEAEEGRRRSVIAGVNWSAALKIPFQKMPFLMTQARTDAHDPIVLLAHLAQPSVRFTDRGKGMLGDV